MATPIASEWDDIPTSSEIFSGDFFGDELMEMYTADHGLNLPDGAESVIAISAAAAVSGAGRSCSSDDFSKHPGILVAMNAAAMDGGLDFLSGIPSEVNIFTAEATVSVPEAPLARAPASATASVAAAAVVAKRPIATRSTPAPSQRNLSKKRKIAFKGMVAATTTTVVPLKAPPSQAKVPAKVAPSGGVMIGLLPTVINRVVSNSASIVSQTVAALAAATAAAQSPVPPCNSVATATELSKIPSSTAIKASIDIPKDTMPAGGRINHQIIAKPVAVSSTVVTAPSLRISLPTSSLSAKAMGKTPDVPASSTGFITSSITGVKVAQSEAEFKDMAAVAVLSLIQNASTSSSNLLPTTAVAKPSGGEKIDTSTAHINALTSQNWVTACGPPTPEDSPSCDASIGEGSACDKAARNAHRATLSQEERAKQNRDRNREHARNTRLRKKAYVEELKRTLTELVSQRDAADIERWHEAQRNREQREVRFRVVEEFLKLRGRNEPNTARWVAILEEGFAFALPRTTYRHMVDADKSTTSCIENDQASSSCPCSEQVLCGAAAVIEDSVHLSTFLNSVGGTQSLPTAQVQIVYSCDRKRFFMDGNVAFLDFHASTLGTVSRGFTDEVTFKGQMKALFSPASNKLISIDMTFDTGTIIQQVEALGLSETDATAAAQDADELLNSLQMPQMFADNYVSAALPPCPMSVSSDDGSERSTDGSHALINA